MDKYFSIMWDVDGEIKTSAHQVIEIKIIRLGGNSMSFYMQNSETQQYGYRDLINKRLDISFQLCIDSKCEVFRINAIVSDVYSISTKQIVNVEYEDMLPPDRDRLFRMLFNVY